MDHRGAGRVPTGQRHEPAGDEEVGVRVQVGLDIKPEALVRLRLMTQLTSTRKQQPVPVVSRETISGLRAKGVRKLRPAGLSTTPCHADQSR